MNDHREVPEDEKKTFDIYHFFSRWDMMLAAAVIIILLVVTLYFVLSGKAVA